MSSFNLLAAHARVAHAAGGDDVASEGASPSCIHVTSVKQAYALGSPPFLAGGKTARGEQGGAGQR
eukprot:CAMPEP_0180406344 /NCGR_PEP_ID=MMETSP0989-20121125/41120_1 /TAXON_ID=697907 /ORGANISM="non described non described, Strain CCMP2293" /LENGTH=65 /DNA_ID=CAMNT_0022410063 /DNA_START=82 /DNA_END=275 /DNA_ORIENTATION=+